MYKIKCGKLITKIGKYSLVFLVLLLWAACGKKNVEPSPTMEPLPTDVTPTRQATNTPTYIVAPTVEPTPTAVTPKVICIDPGHQQRGNADTEPIGPGSDIYKAKVTGGTSGVNTKYPEYKLTLDVSLLLKAELESRGYEVLLTRHEHDVNISNMERASIANDAGADAFIRIHANSSNEKVDGVMTICQTPKNPFNADIYQRCKMLSQCILDSFLAATEANSHGVWETDTMSGINWCRVPVAIVEMGYLSDPEEELRLIDSEYQIKIVKGIADGLDLFFLEIQE